MRDFVYKQNPDSSYVLDNGYFEQEDRNSIVDTIFDILKKIYTGIVTSHNVNPTSIDCNIHLLHQALTRYSRDIFGESRLKARVDSLLHLGRITQEQYSQLCTFNDYGLKVDSCEPYVYRQVANLLYWLSLLKPFSISIDDPDAIKALGVAYDFHNEYISYCFVLAMLKTLNLKLDIHTNAASFSDFLYDLHFRTLSRSSLEFFLDAHVKEKL
jgi:hypothetical protein